MQEKSIKKNAFWGFLRAFNKSFFPLISFPYASRILLPEGIGKINFVNSIVNYFAMIAGLGIGTYAIRESAKRRNNNPELSKFTKEILYINLASTLITYILFFIALFSVPKFASYRFLLILAGLNIFGNFISVEWLLNGLEEFKSLSIRTFMFQCLGLIYLFVFVKTKDDLGNYIIFGLFTSLGVNITNFVYSFKFIDYKIKIVPDLKKHFRPILTFFGMAFVTSIYEMLDTTMLGFISNDTETGYYSAANKLNMLFIRIFAAILGVLLPRLSFYNSNDKNSEYNTLIKKSFEIVLIFTIPLCFGMLVLAKPLVLLFSGDAYLPAIPSMFILSPLIVVLSISNITGVQILPSKNKEKFALFSYIIGAIINFTLNIILIKKYGSVGAATASLTAESIIAVIQLFYLRKMLYSRDLIISLLQFIASSIIMAAAIYFTRFFIENTILQLILCFAEGVILYAAVLLLFRNETFSFIISEVKNGIRNFKK